MSTILTRHGHSFDFSQPDPDAVCIEDIAHALSRLCRYTGHTPEHYCVAQHCVLASMLIPQCDDLPLIALLHDASEAYLGDVSAPLKTLLPDYRRIEENIQALILERFGLRSSIPEEVHEVDRQLLAYEMRDIFDPPRLSVPVLLHIAPMKIKPWSAETAKEAFLSRFWQIQHDLDCTTRCHKKQSFC